MAYLQKLHFLLLATLVAMLAAYDAGAGFGAPTEGSGKPPDEPGRMSEGSGELPPDELGGLSEAARRKKCLVMVKQLANHLWENRNEDYVKMTVFAEYLNGDGGKAERDSSEEGESKRSESSDEDSGSVDSSEEETRQGRGNRQKLERLKKFLMDICKNSRLPINVG